MPARVLHEPRAAYVVERPVAPRVEGQKLRISQARLDDGNDHFDPSTLAVTSFDVGNQASNVIPSRAVARFNIRFSTEHTPQSLRDWVNAQVAVVKAELGGNWTVASNEGVSACSTSPKSPYESMREPSG